MTARERGTAGACSDMVNLHEIGRPPEGTHLVKYMIGRPGTLDTAALMRCLDLVVCVDTAAGHLAGALGVPVWVVLSAVSDWQWLRERPDTPWYPTMKLFRQTRLGVWDDVFARLAADLAHRVGEQSGMTGWGSSSCPEG